MEDFMTNLSDGTKIAINIVLIFFGGGGSVEGLTFGLCGTVNIEHDEDLGLWL